MKKRVTVTLEPALWQQFRVACVTRQVSASSEIETFMAARLKQWERKTGSAEKGEKK